MIKLVSGEAIRHLDRRTEELGMTTLLLMEAAGRGAAEAIRRAYPGPARGRVVALAGKGGNGGDALCAARWLGLWGADVQAILLGEPRGAAVDQASAFSASFPGRLVRVETEEELAPMREEILGADLLIDGILGVGVKGEARGLARSAIELLAEVSSPVVAIDIPSGLPSDSGEVPGPAVRADLTLTMGAPKPCLLLPPAAELAGEVEIIEIPYPPALWEEITPLASVLEREDVARLLPPRPRFGHKGTFGKVLVVGGAVGMAGAAALAAEAALRAGAGLVHLAVPQPIYQVVESAAREALAHPVAAREGMISPEGVEEALRLAEGMDVVLVGPGLGRGEGPARLVEAVLSSGGKLVLDADALFHLASRPQLLEAAPGELVLTPHPGEFAHLVGKDPREVVPHKLAWARDRASDWGATVVLKGPPTAIAAPEGPVYLSTTGNTALSHGGAGDVLAGLIAGLWASGAAALEAALVGVYVHGLAADILAREGAERALLPGDVLEALPRTFRELAV